MANVVMTMCDWPGCEQLATVTVTFKMNGGKVAWRHKDLCDEHSSEWLSGSRRAARGRPPKMGKAKPKATSARKSTRKPARKKTAAKKRSVKKPTGHPELKAVTA
jgi:hypothetical protein